MYNEIIQLKNANKLSEITRNKVTKIIQNVIHGEVFAKIHKNVFVKNVKFIMLQMLLAYNATSRASCGQ